MTSGHFEQYFQVFLLVGEQFVEPFLHRVSEGYPAVDISGINITITGDTDTLAEIAAAAPDSLTGIPVGTGSGCYTFIGKYGGTYGTDYTIYGYSDQPGGPWDVTWGPDGEDDGGGDDDKTIVTSGNYATAVAAGTILVNPTNSVIKFASGETPTGNITYD